jgi:cell division septation protein DedD
VADPGAGVGDTVDVDLDAPAAPQPADRYSVQLAAFRDRSLALAFVARWQRELPEIRVDTTTDERGQMLYKVRTGRFASPVQARTESERVQRRLGLEALVVQAAP